MKFKNRLLILAAGTALVAWPAWAQDAGTDPVTDPDPVLEDVDMGDGATGDGGDTDVGDTDVGDTGDDGTDGDVGDGTDVTDVPDAVEPALTIAPTPPGLAMHGIDLSDVGDISLPPGLEQLGKVPPGHALQAMDFKGPHVGGPPGLAGVGGGPDLGGGMDPASLATGPGRGHAYGRNR